MSQSDWNLVSALSNISSKQITNSNDLITAKDSLNARIDSITQPSAGTNISVSSGVISTIPSPSFTSVIAGTISTNNGLQMKNGSQSTSNIIDAGPLDNNIVVIRGGGAVADKGSIGFERLRITVSGPAGFMTIWNTTTRVTEHFNDSRFTNGVTIDGLLNLPGPGYIQASDGTSCTLIGRGAAANAYLVIGSNLDGTPQIELTASKMTLNAGSAPASDVIITGGGDISTKAFIQVSTNSINIKSPTSTLATFDASTNTTTIPTKLQVPDLLNVDGTLSFPGPASAISADGNMCTQFTRGVGARYITIGRDNGGLGGVEVTADNVTIYGNFVNSSDRRLKRNVEALSDSLSIISRLKGVSFEWKETGRKDVGMIAQDVETVIPHAVVEGKDGFKSVNYLSTIAYLVESVKELTNRIEKLENTTSRSETSRN